MRASILALGPLARALRRGARLAARRLRDRPAPGRPARQGPAGDGRRDRPRARLHQRPGATARRRALRVRRGHRDRHREPADGGDARRRDDHARERRARAGGGRPRALPRRDGRADRGRRHRPHRRSKASTRLHGATHAIMPDRIETGTYLAAVAAAGGDATHRRRRRPDTLDAVLDKLREAGADDRRRRPTRSASRGAGRSRAFNLRTAPYPGFPDRHAGADHGARDARRRHVGHHRDDLREPDDARAGAACASAPTSRSRATPRSCAAWPS